MAVVAALLASALTGIAFGMLPALRASRLDPVDALRYE
jgi:putative ABC transport system permease protein